MHRTIFHFLLAIGLITLTGCAKRERVGPDYVLLTPETLNPDGHPGTSLYYKGKEVWPNVYVGSGYVYHAGIFVFSSPVPDSVPNQDGIYIYDDCISPQLFAVRGAGPPVILSERITADTLDSTNSYRLWQLTSIENGIRVEFEYNTEHQTNMTRDVSWTDIQSWVQEAEVSAPKVVSHLGIYRVLPVSGSAR